MRATTSPRIYPDVTVDPDPIFVRDGNVWTSAGVTAGMDLALALVDDDLGRDVALMTARQLVLFVQRPGGQSQFSAQLGAQVAARDPLRELQQWIAEHPDDDHARRAARGAGRDEPAPLRARVPRRGRLHARRVRRDGARRSRAPPARDDRALRVDEVARAAGFGTPETLRRAFARRVGASPTEYRDRFRPSRAS